MSTKTLLLEDEPATRSWFEARLAECARVHLVASCGTLAAARRAIASFAPELLILDLNLPDGSAIELIREAQQRARVPEIMVVSVFGDEKSVLGAIEAGAQSYILKDANAEDMRRAIDQLLDGGAPISASIAGHVLKRFRAGASAPGAAPVESLSERELQTLKLIARGMSYEEVAEALALRYHTIASYVKQIYRKLEVHSRMQAVERARGIGLIDRN